jgi:hypothetical protein
MTSGLRFVVACALVAVFVTPVARAQHSTAEPATDHLAHRFENTPAQIGAELAEAGFSLETTHDFLPRQIFLVYRAN